MSAAKTAASAERKLDYRLRAGGPWSGAWKIAAGVAVLGLLGVAAGWVSDPHRFAYSYLFAFTFFLTIGLGAMFFVLVQHLTSAAWSVTVRRIAEFFMVALPIFALLFLPVAANMGHLFPWLAHHGHEGAHASGHGAPAARPLEHEVPATHVDEHVRPEDAQHARDLAAQSQHSHQVAALGATVDEEHDEAAGEHARILEAKRPYLNIPFFAIRALLYFLAWSWIALRLFRWSTQQDKTRDPQLTVKAQRFAPPATFIFGLTLTFAAFDWLMSLNPMWYSTIFGVQIFAGCAVTIHALVALVALSFHNRNITGRAINVEHFHDLGKLTFGFLVFWAYISFSQFFLTWYVSIPEETVFYHHRWGNGPWKAVSLFLIFGHFALPFAFLLSRNIKRRLPLLGIGTAWIVVMHLVEIYWIVLPMYGRSHPDPAHRVAEHDPGILAPHWMDLACLLFVGGAYLALVFNRMAKHPVVAVGDPRLDRSLRFENF